MPEYGARPDLRLQLTRYNITTELTATQCSAVLRLNFAAGNLGRLLVLPAWAVAGGGCRPHPSASPTGPTDFARVLRDRVRPRRHARPGPWSRNRFQAGSAARKGRRRGRRRELQDYPAADLSQIKIGSSSIGYEQAERNLRREAG